MLLTNKDHLCICDYGGNLILHFQVKRAGSLLLGGAAQSHPEVQAAAVQAGHRIKLGSEKIVFKLKSAQALRLREYFPYLQVCYHCS